jgi:hypothetical protein
VEIGPRDRRPWPRGRAIVRNVNVRGWTLAALRLQSHVHGAEIGDAALSRGRCTPPRTVDAVTVASPYRRGSARRESALLNSCVNRSAVARPSSAPTAVCESRDLAPSWRCRRSETEDVKTFGA